MSATGGHWAHDAPERWAGAQREENDSGDENPVRMGGQGLLCIGRSPLQLVPVLGSRSGVGGGRGASSWSSSVRGRGGGTPGIAPDLGLGIEIPVAGFVTGKQISCVSAWRDPPTHSHTLIQSHTLTRTVTHSLVHTHTCMHTHSHTHSFIVTYRHTHAHILSHTFTHIHTYMLIQSHTHSHTHTHTYSYSHTHSHRHTLNTYTLIQSHTQSHSLILAAEVSTREAGADVKERGLFSGAGPLEDGDSGPQARLPLSAKAQFCEEGEGAEQGDQGAG